VARVCATEAATHRTSKEHRRGDLRRRRRDHRLGVRWKWSNVPASGCGFPPLSGARAA